VVATAATLAVAAASAPARAADPGPGLLAHKAPAALADAAAAQPNQIFRVIVQGGAGIGTHVARAIAQTPAAGGPHVVDRFQSIPAVSAQLSGAELATLAADGSVDSITPDEPAVSLAAKGPGAGGPPAGKPGQGGGPGAGGPAAGGPSAVSTSDPAWPVTVGVVGRKPVAGAPAIAIVDSGIDPRVTGINPVASVSLYSGTATQSPGDGNGHGSFVANLAAGTIPGHTGAAPGAPVVSIDVMADNGDAWTSDLIRACDWILQNKDRYNIRVVNFSMQSSAPSSFLYDPLDAAVERLWLSGVTVVTAAGNYAQDGAQSGVPYAPANDPFVITVGAADDKGSPTTQDDTAAPWSAWGYTADGFMKPELSAPGRYIVGTVGEQTTLMKQRRSNKVGPNLIELSGTSFAAPIVSGIVDDLLVDHPTWTPDQLKGALMVSARSTAQQNLQLGVGEANFRTADAVTAPPNPNAALDQFVRVDAVGSAPAFDTAAWESAASSNAAWSSAAWASAAWSSAAWSSAAWSSAAWSSAAWASAAWSSAAWESAAWESAAWESAAWSDAAAADGLGAG
jgi:serine protease AprX